MFSVVPVAQAISPISRNCIGSWSGKRRARGKWRGSTADQVADYAVVLLHTGRRTVPGMLGPPVGPGNGEKVGLEELPGCYAKSH
jgi:hypothetical protein